MKIVASEIIFLSHRPNCNSEWDYINNILLQVSILTRGLYGTIRSVLQKHKNEFL